MSRGNSSLTLGGSTTATVHYLILTTGFLHIGSCLQRSTAVSFDVSFFPTPFTPERNFGIVCWAAAFIFLVFLDTAAPGSGLATCF